MNKTKVKSNSALETAHKPKIKIEYGKDYKFVQDVVSSNNLHTVCEEARCPNMFECWGRGTATIMILGDICTRACGFCSVKTGKPQKLDIMEPHRTALAVKKMRLRHVVITSVDRDDLKADFGSEIWAETIKQIHRSTPNCTVEVLTPDFQGHIPSLHTVFNAKPEIEIYADALVLYLELKIDKNIKNKNFKNDINKIAILRIKTSIFV